MEEFSMANIKEKAGLKTGQAIALVVIAVLNILWLVCVVLQGSMTVTAWVALLEFAVAAFYAIYGYKKPHGNHMRHLLLLYAVIAAVMLLINTAGQPTYISALYLANIILVVYMGGRLDRFKQNIIISIAVLVCNSIVSGYLVGNIISSGRSLTFMNFGSCIGCVTVWLIIAASYIIRYKPHKEAGIAADKD